MSRPPILVPPRGTRSYRLTTARGEFAVLDNGTASRGTALLVPGFTGSKEDFLALLEPLARSGFRAVAVDGRGQYESGGPRDQAAYAQRELARDVLAQAAALRAGPVHLLGHSLGGLIARAAVLTDPAPFASLTLMSSGPAAVTEDRQEQLRMLLAAFPALSMEQIWQAMSELDPPEAAEAADPAIAYGEAHQGEVQAFLRRRWLANTPEQLMVTARQLIGEPDRVAQLAAVPLPKHVVSGETDDAWPVPLMDEMARRLRARRTVIEGAGHSPNAERPESTAAALAGFWDGAATGGAAPRQPAVPPARH